MIAKRVIGTVGDKEISEVTVKNKFGISFSAMTYGATITKLIVPDRNGTPTDIAVGFESVEDYVQKSDNQGAAIGRCCNRIGGAKFTIDGTEYHIDHGEGNNVLHGNDEFRTAVWNIDEIKNDSVTFSYTSPDGSNGFPGTLETKITYKLEKNNLRIIYNAVSDKKTPINLTNHLYFNLSGDSERTVEDHTLYINADAFTPADEELIVTGEIHPVDGTSLDFRTPKTVGKDIDSDEFVKAYGGYDLNFCLNEYDGSLRHVSTLSLEENGIEMKVFTDLPGMQVYSGNMLAEHMGKYSKHFCLHGAICLETQYYPDAVNHDNFDSCVFEAGKEFNSETVYSFGNC